MPFVYFGILGTEEVSLLRMDLVNHELLSNYNGNDPLASQIYVTLSPYFLTKIKIRFLLLTGHHSFLLHV